MQIRNFSRRLPLSSIFGIDRRTLALFRIILACLLLSDLWNRARDVVAFYSDAGVLPRAAQIEIYGNEPWFISLHLMSGLIAVQVALFIAVGLCALALLIGYRTWWATLFSWVLLISLHNRNPMTLQGGDVLLRLLLFWSLFLPLGALFSLDWALKLAGKQNHKASETPPASTSQATSPFLSTGTLGILLQVCFVYWFAYALKNDPSWRTEGTALYYALSIDQLVKPLGTALLGYPALLRALTFLTVWIERFGPFLALLPFWRLRLAVVFVFIGFHIFMALCLTLGIFPFAAMAAWLLFVPQEVWESAEKYARSSSSQLAKTMNRARAITQRFPSYLASRGLSSGPQSKASVRATGIKSGLNQSIAAFALIYIFCWNLRTVDYASYSRLLPASWNWIGVASRTDQIWDMFAPYPLKEVGWFIAAARLPDGSQVDLLRQNAPLSWQKPAQLANSYPDALWQKYHLNLWAASNSAHRAYYAAYLTRNWNQEHPNRRIKSLELIFMREDTLPEGRTAKPQKIVTWQQTF